MIRGLHPPLQSALSLPPRWSCSSLAARSQLRRFARASPPPQIAVRSLSGLQDTRDVVMVKRKRSIAAQAMKPVKETPVPLPAAVESTTRERSKKKPMAAIETASALVKTEVETEVTTINRRGLSTVSAAQRNQRAIMVQKGVDHDSDPPLSDLSEEESPEIAATVAAKTSRAMRAERVEKVAAPATPKRKTKPKKEDPDEAALRDPEADDDEPIGEEEEIKAALSRPPQVNSDYLPLPWKGRLGYVS